MTQSIRCPYCKSLFQRTPNLLNYNPAPFYVECKNCKKIIKTTFRVRASWTAFIFWYVLLFPSLLISLKVFPNTWMAITIGIFIIGGLLGGIIAELVAYPAQYFIDRHYSQRELNNKMKIFADQYIDQVNKFHKSD